MYVVMYLFITIAAALIAVTVKYIPLFNNHSSSTLNESEPRNKIFYMKYMSNIIIKVYDKISGGHFFYSAPAESTNDK